MTYTCIICHEQFTDVYNHVREHKKGDEEHRDYLRLLEFNPMDELGTGSHPCFCGGKIQTFFANENSWETVCLNCHTVYDED